MAERYKPQGKLPRSRRGLLAPSEEEPAREAHQNSEARLHAILTTEIDAIVVIDEGGVVESVNPAFTRIFGYDPGEVVGKNVNRLMPEPYATEHDGYLSNHLRSGEPKIIGKGREVEGKRKDGTRFPIDLAVSEMLVGTRRLFLGIVRDISEARRVEIDLRESEQRYRELFESTHDLIQSVSTEGDFLFVNAAWQATLGYTEEEAKELKLLDVLHAGSGKRSHKLIERLLAGETLENVEAVFVTKDGREVQVEGHATGRYRNGKLMGSHGFFRDVTRRHARERALRVRQEAIAASITPFAFCDLEGQMIYANKAFIELWGFESEEEVVGLPLGELGRSEEKVREILEAVRRDGSWTGNDVARKKDGSPFDVYLSTTLVADSAGKPLCIQSTFLDMSELKLLTRRLVEQESLATLGEMSAMVAHEVKNPIAGIISGMRLLQKRLAEGSFEREVVEEVLATTESLGQVVRDMLAFSKPQIPEARSVPARILLEDVISSVSRDPDFTDVEITLSGEECTIRCDAEMLKPVFLNLLQNAAHAMDGRGTLRISLENGDGRVRVIVWDNGPGIAEEKLQKVFEPFFSTRGGGTGLGLTIAKRMVELHQGSISIDCPSEGGTRVIIDLPLA